ncbi:MAG: FAD-binding oxidoreductase [Hyphomicrobiaceae bacterium]
MEVAAAANGRSRDVDTAISVLKQRFGERVQTGEAIRRQHGHTLTWLENQPPDVVVWPNSTEEVADVVRIAARYRVPVIPFGAGTSLEGHVNAPLGGISLDFSNMSEVLEVNCDDLDCVVQPGISRKAINEYLRDTGLFFPIDPGAEEATLGGMAATRASGTNAVLYGTMRDNVLNLTAVMADGSVVRTGGRARKSAAGYDLTRLLVGSEGTLGIITELTVQLYGIPETILAAVCPFETLEGACSTVMQAIQLGLGLARIELLDEVQIYAVNRHSKLTLEERPTLFLEFHGTKVAARDQVETFRSLAEAEGAVRFDWAEREEDRRRLWKARHEVYWSVRSTWPALDTLATDVCVPISRLAECVLETKRDVEASGLVAPIVGHVGDGNFHTSPVFDKSDPAQRRKVECFLERLADRAIAMEGTCTGEHGIGQGKIKYLEAEIGHGVEIMRLIKHALDPQDILNPRKIVV